MVIIDPDAREADRAPVIEKLTGLIPQKGGLLVALDEWGSKKLAYPIRKKVRGFYLRLDYCGQGDLVNELERLCRIDDRVLKYMTVQLDEAVDLEQIQAQIAAAQSTPAEPTAATPAVAATTAAATETASPGGQNTEAQEEQ
jgi:small subunit ribosomal protein S6